MKKLIVFLFAVSLSVAVLGARPAFAVEDRRGEIPENSREIYDRSKKDLEKKDGPLDRLLGFAKQWFDARISEVLATVEKYVGIDLREMGMFFDEATGKIDMKAAQDYLAKKLSDFLVEKLQGLVRKALDYGLGLIKPAIDGVLTAAIAAIGTIPLVGGALAAAASFASKLAIDWLKDRAVELLTDWVREPVAKFLAAGLDTLRLTVRPIQTLLDGMAAQLNQFAKFYAKVGSEGLAGALVDEVLNRVVLAGVKDEALRSLLSGLAVDAVKALTTQGMRALDPAKILGQVADRLVDFLGKKLAAEGLPGAEGIVRALAAKVRAIASNPAAAVARGVLPLLADFVEPFAPWLEQLLSGGGEPSPLVRTVLAKVLEYLRQPEALGRLFTGSFSVIVEKVGAELEPAIRATLVDNAPPELRPMAEMVAAYLGNVIRDGRGLMRALQRGGLKGIALEVAESLGPALASMGRGLSFSLGGLTSEVQRMDLRTLFSPKGLPTLLAQVAGPAPSSPCTNPLAGGKDGIGQIVDCLVRNAEKAAKKP